MQPGDCSHLMHLPSGKCIGCGEQHQPLADYQPGDDEKYLADDGPTAQPGQEQRMEIEALTDAEAEAAFFTIIGMFDKLGCAPGGTFEKKEDAGVTFRLHFNVERVRRLLAATRPTTASASEVTDAMIEAAWCAHLEFLGKPASPFPSSRTDCRALYSAIHAAMQAARPTADLGEDGELARAIYEALKADGGDAWMDDGQYLESVTLDGSFDLLVAARHLRAVLSRSGL